MKVVNSPERKAFVKLRKAENKLSYHPVSLASNWTGRGFKDQFVDRQWQSFLEGWSAQAQEQIKRKESFYAQLDL